MAFNINTASGDYNVNLSPELLSRFQASKNSNKKSTSNGPNDTYFSIRYGFRPDSIDDATVSTLTKEKDDYVLESKSTGSLEESHIFRGQLSATKDLECVLVYNSETKSFDLVPLDLTLRVNPSREKPKKNTTLVVPNPSSGRGQQSNPPSRSISPIDIGERAIEKATPTIERTSTPVPNVATTLSTAPATSTAKVRSSTSKVPKTTSTASASAPSTSAPSTSKLRSTTASKAPPKTQPSRHRTASKSIPRSSEPVVVDQNEEDDDDDDDDDDLLGALANELEESLEDDSKNAQQEESEESDEDDHPSQNSVTIVESRHRAAPVRSNYSSPVIPQTSSSRTGPISLRGYVAGSRPEEEELSSSEEE